MLDELLTDGMRRVVAALDTSHGSSEYDAALQQLADWGAGDLVESDDAGHRLLVTPDGSVQLRLGPHVLGSVMFEAAGHATASPFAGLAQLFEVDVVGRTKAELRATFGEPFTSYYGNETYVLPSGHTLVLGLGSRGVLQRVILAATEAGERAALLRKAERQRERAAASRPQRVEVSDEDGFLALVDGASYRSSLPGWTFESLTARFVEEMDAEHALVWRTGCDSYAEYVVELVGKKSRRRAHREAEHTVTVTEGRLLVVDYTTLTTAADDDEAIAGDATLTLPDGRYSLLLRQLFDPADDDVAERVFELVARTSRARAAAVPVTEPLWWTA